MEREQEQTTALEQVQSGGGGNNLLDKALDIANQAAEQEQEKVAALDMHEQENENRFEDWNQLSEMEKSDLLNDLASIDDYGLGR